MKLDPAAVETLRALRRANGASFTDLVEIAGLDPARDFRDADLSDIDFAGSNLDGYDFSGAKLSNASFVGAYNYDHAVFARAELDDVTWPGSWRPKQGERLRCASLRLNRIQQDILDVLLKTLKSHPSARAVAMLPPGVGRSAILVEVIRNLTRTKAFLKGLILCETVAERDQLIRMLRDRAIATADNENARDRSVIPLGEILVETYGNYNRMQNELDMWNKEEGNPLKCTHVALTSLPSRRRSAITRIADAEGPPTMLAFIDALAVKSSGKDRLKQRRLGTVFKSITYQYEIEQAVADGLLVASELINRSHAISKFGERWGASDDERALAKMEEVASDYHMEIDSASQPLATLLIVPEQANAKHLVDEFGLQLLRVGDGLGEPPRVVVLTAREPRGDWVLPPRRGVVAISTPAVADDLDLCEFGLIVVLTGLPERLATKLMFMPARRVEAGRIRVFDYVGTLSETAKERAKDT